MRRIAKGNWLGAILALAIAIGMALPGQALAATLAPNGVTISPATLTLSLVKGAAEQHASFAITNHYRTPVAFHFSFAQPVVTPMAAGNVLNQLRITPADTIIGAGQTFSPVITLTDNQLLAPGSQQVELVITQASTPGQNVTVVPSLRMPLIIIKQDGAVAALTANSLDKPAFAFDIPAKVSLALYNTGNVVTIPRGYISVHDPRGRVVGKGIINEASAAVVPGGQLRASPTIAALDHAWLPGIYRVEVNYGVGGGATAQTVSAHFFYMPVWQMLLTILLAAMAYTGWQIWVEWQRLRRLRSDRPPAEPEQPLTDDGGIA